MTRSKSTRELQKRNVNQMVREMNKMANQKRSKMIYKLKNCDSL